VSTAEVEAIISNMAGLKDAVVYGVEVMSSYSVYTVTLCSSNQW